MKISEVEKIVLQEMYEIYQRPRNKTISKKQITKKLVANNIANNQQIHSVFIGLEIDMIKQSPNSTDIVYLLPKAIKICEEMALAKSQDDNVEVFFNTQNEHFNNNAYFWYLELNKTKLFENLETPFKILSCYLDFHKNYRNPISTVKSLTCEMDENNLTKDQRLFILDKLGGLIANADEENRENFFSLNIEILDARFNIEPLNIDANKYNLESILEIASEYANLNERLKYLKHQKLSYEKEALDLGRDIGLGDEIDIEIEHLQKLIEADKGSIVNTDFEKASKIPEDIMDKIQEFIKKSNTKEAIEYILENKNVIRKEIIQEITLLSSQFMENEKKIRLGLIDEEVSVRIKSQINYAILKIND